MTEVLNAFALSRNIACDAFGMVIRRTDGRQSARPFINTRRKDGLESPSTIITGIATAPTCLQDGGGAKGSPSAIRLSRIRAPPPAVNHWCYQRCRITIARLLRPRPQITTHAYAHLSSRGETGTASGAGNGLLNRNAWAEGPTLDSISSRAFPSAIVGRCPAGTHHNAK